MSSEQERREKLAELRKTGLVIPVTAYADLARDFPTSQTRDWEWWSAIWPCPNRFNTGDQHGSIVQDARESWDASTRFVKGQEAIRAEHEVQKAAEAAERQKKDAAYETARLARLTEELRQRYMRTPGATDADFAADLPGMLRERAHAAAMDDTSDAPMFPAHRMW